jgi:hypothetical protein
LTKFAIEIPVKAEHLFVANKVMSRNTIILLVLLCGGIAGLIAFSKLKPKSGAQPDEAQPVARETTEAAKPRATGQNNVGNAAIPPRNTEVNPAVPPTGQGTTATTQGIAVLETKPAPKPLTLAPLVDDGAAQAKPVPVLEKDYATATNRDTRLDIMMDIAEIPGAESVKALTRLFEAETDLDLKVDLLDSLLGIEGFKDEKLIMLTMGARQGLPSEVRQSAIDGLIDLEDPRAVPILNGLLNDPDPEIREGAKDALEILQSEPPTPVKK